MTRSIRAVTNAIVLLGFVSAAHGAQDQPPAGRQQPAVEKPAAKSGQADDAPSNTPPADALLSSPDAREVAGFGCATGPTDCPLTAGDAAAMSAGLLRPLQKADGSESDLSKAVKTLLKGKYKDALLWDKRAPAVAVHIVESAGAGKVHDRWLLATRAGDGVDLSEGRRIYGAKTIGLVFVLLNVDVAKADDAQTAYSDLSYRVIIKKKLPDNVKNLLALLKFALAQGQAAVKAEKVSIVGFGTVTGVGVPSDVTFFGVRTTAMTAVGSSVQFDNEGKYWWDMSVAVPITKLSMLDYSQDTNVVVPKQINKQSIYAAVNLYPFPVDTKSGNLRWVVPRFVAGIGLTGRPGENILVGGAWGFQYLQFFVGAAIANQTVPAGSTPPASGADLTQKYTTRWSFGLNVPVASALKQLTSSDNAASSGDKADGKPAAAPGADKSGGKQK